MGNDNNFTDTKCEFGIKHLNFMLNNKSDKYLEYPNWFTKSNLRYYLYFGIDFEKETFFKLLKLINKKNP